MKNLHLAPLSLFATVALIFAGAAGSSWAAILDLSAAPVVSSGVHGGGNASFLAEHAFDGVAGTRWAATYGQATEWIHVDLGEDHTLNTISIDWETAAATNYKIRIRTDAQGPEPNPANWTDVATTTGMNAIPGGGDRGGPVGGGSFDIIFDFNGGSVESGRGGTSVIDVQNPVGRYVMVYADNWAGQCCNGTSIWEIQIDAVPGVLEDTDGDGLPDVYEQKIIDFDPGDAVDGLEDVAGPNDAPATTDFDGDGLSDAAEYELATDPTDDDTDDDALLDGVETKTGVWNGTGDTGTDPKKADSDGDTLSDGLENPDLPFLGAGQPGTDPNKADTDNDTLSDSVELALGSDPTDPASPGILNLSTAPVESSGVHGGGNPSFIAEHAFDGQVGTRWAAAYGQPEEWIHVDLGAELTLNAVAVDWETAAATNYTLRMRTEAEGPDPDPANWTIIASTTGMGTIPGGGAAGGPLAGFDIVYSFAGAGNVLSGFGGTSTIEVPGATGRYLMLHANNWAGQCCNGTSIWEIQVAAGPANLQKPALDISYHAGTGELSISWDSLDGKLYNLRSESDPSLAEPILWPIFNGNTDVAATPPRNTLTFPLPAESERFFVVEEFNAPPVSIYSDDFESGQGTWTTGTGPTHQAGTDWQFGSPSATGPAAAHSGSNCFGTNLSGPTAVDADVRLISPPIDLTTAAAATLNFFQYRDIEDTFDIGTITILDAADDAELTVLESNITGFSGEWEAYSKSLPAAALGKVIKLKFTYVTDNFDDVDHAGWYIDDVNVTVP